MLCGRPLNKAAGVMSSSPRRSRTWSHGIHGLFPQLRANRHGCLVIDRAELTRRFVQRHPLDPQDAAATSAIRALAASTKGTQRGIEARPLFDALMESVQPQDDVSFQKDTVGGISGLWVHPPKPRPGAAILHFHGGWFQ